MHHILRVEDQDGRGPYRILERDFIKSPRYTKAMEALRGRLDAHAFDGQRRPTPHNDPGIARYIDKPELCGFTSMRALKAWFTKAERKALFEAGFRAVWCVVASHKMVKKGAKQVLVDRSSVLGRVAVPTALFLA